MSYHLVTSSASLTASLEHIGSPKFQCGQFVYPLRPQTPARRYILAFLAYIDVGFRHMETLARMQCGLFRGSTPSRFRIVADKLLPRGFAQLVTSLNARFCNGRVANSYPCRIVRLNRTSLAWRSHLLIPGSKNNPSHPIGN